MAASRLEVVKNEFIYKLKVVFSLSLFANIALAAAGVMSALVYGFFGGAVVFLVLLVLDLFLVVRVSRGFNSEEVLKHGGFKQ